MNQRAREFLDCLGNGKTIYEIEVEDEQIEDLQELQSKYMMRGFGE